ncbi:unnamed protein product [Ambrosiozyma monospora]|uniref:Unnamed protein product n=1 Tax=Ambrosiozyma monospora TaxID=43982 RepID=A0ACB5U1C5_AMBMO|nr:unnamed protein product [Ambrosiozyma monospora]
MSDNQHTSPFDDKYRTLSTDNFNSSSQGTSTDSPYFTDPSTMRRDSSYARDANSSISDAGSIEFSPAIKQTKTFASVNLKEAHVAFDETKPQRNKTTAAGGGGDEDEDEEEEDDALGELPGSGKEGPKRQGTVFKRHRWGTQRRKDGKVVVKPMKRTKTFKRSLSKRTPNTRLFSGNDAMADEDEDQNSADKDRSREKRQVYWNVPLPESQLDEDGHPPQYPRNKIRTTKYTPLSFVPKNLYYQFENVANIYFLVMIILGAFSIFGVPNPIQEEQQQIWKLTIK